jgi:hypothetical protein
MCETRSTESVCPDRQSISGNLTYHASRWAIRYSCEALAQYMVDVVNGLLLRDAVLIPSGYSSRILVGLLNVRSRPNQ